MTVTELRAAATEFELDGLESKAELLHAAADEIEFLRSEHKKKATWKGVKEVRRRTIERMTPDQRQVLAAMEGVAIGMGWSWEQLAGNGKSQPLVRARETVWGPLHDVGLSYPDIGKLYGKNHSTIILACRRAKKYA